MKTIRNVGLLTLAVAVTLLTAAFILNNFVYFQKPIQLALDSTVLITTKEADGQTWYGSGVVFKNGDRTFIWTCHHVIEPAVNIQLNLDLHSKKFKADIKTQKVKISSKLFGNKGEEIGEVVVWADVVRFSAAHDLALLEIPSKYFRTSVTFPVSYDYTPNAGTKILHVGNFGGPGGEKSVSEGIAGISGLDLDGDGKLYDRVGLGFQGGSSGGGVFEANTGHCIGIIARTINRANMNQGLIIPYRRMVDFCKETDCEWALNRNVAVPTDYRDRLTADILDVPGNVLRALEGVHPANKD